jgi:hypothetical protein
MTASEARREGYLLLRQRVSALAIDRLQPQHIIAAQTANRSGKVSSAARPLANLTGYLRCEFRPGESRRGLPPRHRVAMADGAIRHCAYKGPRWRQASTATDTVLAFRIQRSPGRLRTCQVSEIFDGDPPHRAVGCIAQAWSVAELLRATVEDIYGVRPGQIESGKEMRRRESKLHPLSG